MNGIKQKRRVRTQKRRMRQHKQSMLLIGGVMMLLVVVLGINGLSLRAKNQEYIAQEEEIKSRIAEEQNRSNEIDEMEGYVGTEEYIREMARERLGLIDPNEIIFRPEE